MKVIPTPEERFKALPDYPFEPTYTDLGGVRMHHVEAEPRSAAPVLLLHGEPTWSFLYRHMLRAHGLRIARCDLSRA